MLPHQFTENCCSQAAVVVQSFNPSQHLGGRSRLISLEFEDSIVYRASSRTSKVIQRNLVSKKQKRNCCTWQDCQLH